MEDIIKSKLHTIHRIIKEMVCCDFELVKYEKNTLTIGCGLSLSYPHKMLITFEGVFLLAIAHEWSVDTAFDCIEIMPIEAAKAINLKYEVERGHFLFKIIPMLTDKNAYFYVVAKNIDFNI